MKKLWNIYIDSWRNFGRLSGTLTRGEFWGYYFLNIFITYFVIILLEFLEKQYLGCFFLYSSVVLIQCCFAFAISIQIVCSMVKRLRDAGYGPLKLLWVLLPILGIFYVLYLLIKRSKTKVIHHVDKENNEILV